MPRARTLKLAVTGTAAGLFSGLFGVGGGSVIVPLLALWMGYDERRATGTSLAAIVVIAALSAVGVLGGVSLATTLPERTLRFGFAALMLFIAIQFLRRGARTRRARAPGPRDK